MSEVETILLDGSFVARYGYEVHKELSWESERGRVETGCLYGFLDTAISWRRRFGGRIIVCWDRGYGIRTAIDPTYKQNRRDNPWEERDRYEAQKRLLMKVLPYTGFTQAYAPEHEGDDVMVTLSKRLPKPIMVVSSDWDLHQVIAPGVKLLRKFSSGRVRESILGIEEHKAKWGFGPEHFPWFQSLVGCVGDNVSGVKGMGKKRAADLIENHSDVYEQFVLNGNEEVLEGSGLQKVVVNALRNGRDDALRSLKLVTMRDDAPVVYIRSRFRPAELLDLLEYYGCYDLTKDTKFKWFGENAID